MENFYPEEKEEIARHGYVQIAEGTVQSPLVNSNIRIYLVQNGIDLVVFHPAMDEEAFIDGDHPKDDPVFQAEIIRLLVAAGRLSRGDKYELGTAESGLQLPSASVFESIQSHGEEFMPKLYSACGVLHSDL